MGDNINIPLLILDFVVVLPVTLLRLFIIYMYGSKYNVPKFELLDIIMHATNPKFNYGTKSITTNNKNVMSAINDILNENEQNCIPKSAKKNKSNNDELELLNDELDDLQQEIDTDTICNLIKTTDEQSKIKQKCISNTIDGTVTDLSQLISTLIDNKQHKPRENILTSKKIIHHSSTSASTDISSSCGSDESGMIKTLNMPELINTTPESEEEELYTNTENESSFAIKFTDDKK